MKPLVVILGCLLAGPAMAVTIAGKPVTRAADLSERATLVLAAINNGTAWLEWAIRSEQRYDFESEQGLLVGIQTGLHGNPLVLIDRVGLQVHPARLMDLSEGDLRALVMGTDEARAIVTRMGWATQRELAVIPQTLDGLGVRNSPVFQAVTLTEQLELLRAFEAGSGWAVTLQREAAAFAIGVAKNPMEFCDYFRLYGAAGANGGAGQVREAMAVVTNGLFGMLAGPLLVESPSEASVGAVLKEWAATGRTLGFGRFSLGMRHAALMGIETLQATVKGVLGAAETAQMSASQTGDEFLFHYQAEGHSVTVKVDGSGNVSLAQVE